MKFFRFIATTSGIAVLAGAVNWIFNARFSFNLWDNFETFTPITLAGHALWLEGHVPVLDLAQCLGTPIIGNAQSGLLYFPTTLGLLLLRALGVADQNLPELMGIFHLAVALSGWDALLRRMGVRANLSVICATGLVACGFFAMGTAVFEHIGSEYGWFPWLLRWILELTDSPKPLRAGLTFALLWYLCAAGSHAQMLLYIMMNLTAFAILYTWVKSRRLSAWVKPLVLILWLPLLSAPALSYTMVVRRMIQRTSEVPREWFLEASIDPSYLIGLFTPFFQTGQSMIGSDYTLFTHAGAWIPAALLLWRRPRGQRALGVGLLAIGLIFLDFALGEHGLIYPHTYGLPVWSSFRWPYKFTYHWIAMFALLAALMLESEWSRLTPRLRHWVAAVVAILPLTLAFPSGGAQWTFWAAQAVLLFWIAGLRRYPHIFCLIYLGSSLWMISESKAHRYIEKYGEYGAAYFGLQNPTESRLVPLSFNSCDDQGLCQMQSLGVFDSATVNGYSSLSGHIMGTSADSLNLIVSSNAWGVISPQVVQMAAGKSLYRSLAARYYLVADRDLAAYRLLLEQRGLTEHKRGPGWTVFEDRAARGLLSVPDEVVSIGPLTREVFGGPDSNRLTAYVQGLDRPIRPSPMNLSAPRLLPGRGLKFDVENNSVSESLLQAAVFPWPFLEARTADGSLLKTYPSNGVATAIVVPPGRFSIALTASLQPLLIGLLIALVSLLAGLAALRWASRSDAST